MVERTYTDKELFPKYVIVTSAHQTAYGMKRVCLPVWKLYKLSLSVQKEVKESFLKHWKLSAFFEFNNQIFFVAWGKGQSNFLELRQNGLISLIIG